MDKIDYKGFKAVLKDKFCKWEEKILLDAFQFVDVNHNGSNWYSIYMILFSFTLQVLYNLTFFGISDQKQFWLFLKHFCAVKMVPTTRKSAQFNLQSGKTFFEDFERVTEFPPLKKMFCLQ